MAGLDTDQFDDFHRYICALLDEVAIPKTLGKIGVTEDCAERIAEKALQDSAVGTNPHPLTTDGNEITNSIIVDPSIDRNL